MFVIRNYVTTGGTVACALAIGYLMQNGPASQPDVQETRQAMIQPSGEGTVIAGLEGIVLTSATPNASTAPEPSAKVPPGQSLPFLRRRSTAISGPAQWRPQTRQHV